MRKIVLNLTVSLDGFIEGHSGEYDWCFTDQDYGMTEFLASTDAVFCGRKSYDLLRSVGDEILNGKKKYVFSRSLEKVENDWILINDLEGENISSIMDRPGKDIWLFGGSSLTGHLLKLGLVDRMILSIHPIILGGGTPLFDPRKDRIKLKLVQSEIYDTGLVQLTYEL